MYKRNYEKPSVNVFGFDEEDVITSTEGGENEKNDFDMWRG